MLVTNKYVNGMVTPIQKAEAAAPRQTQAERTALAEEKKGKRIATAMRKDLKDLIERIGNERRKDAEAAAKMLEETKAGQAGEGDAASSG